VCSCPSVSRRWVVFVFRASLRALAMLSLSLGAGKCTRGGRDGPFSPVHGLGNDSEDEACYHVPQLITALLGERV
jgi:hypothetical protein